MKKAIFMILLIMLVVNAYPLMKFQEGNHYPNTLIVGFDAKIINTTTGDIDVQNNSRGAIQIGVQSFDSTANQFGFSNIERMFYVENQDWHDENGLYPMNIFKITIEDNSLIDNALEALSRDSNVMFAEFEVIHRLRSDLKEINDPDIARQWHLHRIEAPELWNYFQGDENIIIAIVDSGVKWNHVDLKDNIYIRESELVGRGIDWANGVITGDPGGGTGGAYPGNTIYGDVIGWNFYSSQSNQSYQSFRGNTHGTHVAGTAAAVGGNDTMGSGVAPNAKILVTRHQSITEEDQYVHNPYHGIYYAADRGAHVMNASWGSDEGGSPTIANNAVNYALSQGTVSVIAAGNTPLGNVYPGSGNQPASADNAISVAMLNQSDRKVPSSNYGTHLAIAAPGQGILATSYSGSLEYAVDIMESMMGTSMASPIVAGVAAMTMAMNPHLLPTDIKDKLMRTADPLPDEPLFEQGLMGAGRVNALKAVMGDYLPGFYVDGDIIVAEYEGDGDGIPNIGETISVKINLINEAGWTDARGTTATLSTEIPGVNIVQGTLEYNNYIESGEKATLLNYAVLQLTRSVNLLDIPFSLTIESNQSATNPYPYRKVVPIIIKVSMSKPNWPLILDSESGSSPLVTDLDGTGKKLITYSNGSLHVLDVQKNYSPGFPLNIGGNLPGDFAVGNVARNSAQQIVIVTQNGRLVVVDHLGAILNEYDFGTVVRSTPIIADLNNDGHYEIIVATQNGNLFVLNGNDLSVWNNYPVSIGNNILANMAVGDVNGDGIQNIVINYWVGSDQGVHVINPMTGQNIDGFPYRGHGQTLLGPSLANLTGGSGLNIVFAGTATSNCPVIILNSDGTVYRQTTISSNVRTEIAIIDLFNNGVPHLVFGDGAGFIHVMNTNLEYMSGFPKSLGSRMESSPVFADLDGNGTREIIFGDDIGRLHVLQPYGNYFQGYPLQMSNFPLRRSPWVGNFDRDRGDILVVTSNGIDYIDTKLKAYGPTWNTLRGNKGKTASFNDPRTPIEDPINPNLVDILHQNYPNPFNPETTISFSIKNNEHVRLSIYNIRGQLVKTLINDDLNAGEHFVVWDGNDYNNLTVSSGLYFYRIETNTFNDVKRMVLLK